MPPYQPDHIEMLRIARARADELRTDWQTANRKWPERERPVQGSRRGVTRAAREATGRALIGLGRRLLPIEGEPCS
jgi:hypothetical protein